MRKILHILNTSTFSGAENVVITIINNMKNEYLSAYVSYDGAIRNVLIDSDIEFIPIRNMSIREVRNVVNQYNPDIIHAHDYTASIVAAFSTYKIPVISHLHNNSPWIKKINLRSIAYLISTIRYSKILGVSESIFSEYVFGNIIKKKQLVISNPIDINKIIDKSKDVLVGRNDVFDIIFLGRLEEAKDPIRFIRIIDQVIKKIPDIKVAIVGGGSLELSIKSIIENNGLSDNIELFGFLENPYVLLAKSKILCMTSKWEGFGLVAVEAMTFGLPVISTKVGGVPTIVNEKCGYLTDCDDDYHEEIIRLLTSETYYEIKSIEAKNRAASFDNLDSYKKKLIEVYDKSTKRFRGEQ